MAKFNGNIFNRARGSIGGQTFSEAAYRKGKLQTGRQRVAPTNPNTIPQQLARQNMRDSIKIAQRLQLVDLINAFKKTVKKLPAFQAATSIFQRLKHSNGTKIIFDTESNPVGENEIAPANNTSFVYGGTGTEYHVGFATSGENAKSDDIIVVLIFNTEADINYGTKVRFENYSRNRSQMEDFFIDAPLLDGRTNSAFIAWWMQREKATGQILYSQINFRFSI